MRLLKFTVRLLGGWLILLSVGLMMARHATSQPIIGFVSNQDGDYEPYFMTADGRYMGQLLRNEADNYSFIWQPEQRLIFYSANNNDIYREKVGSRQPQRLLRNHYLTEADRDWLYATQNTGSLYRLKRDGSQEQQLTFNETVSLAIAPNGRQIATAINDVNGLTDIYVMQADGSQAQIIRRAGIEYNLAWSPDGEWLAFVRASTQKTGAQLFRIRLDGSESLALTANDVQITGITDVEWSPDSQWVIYQTFHEAGRYVLYRVHRDGGEPEILAPGEATYTGSADWSEAGIVFDARYQRDQDIYRLLPDGTMQQLTDLPSMEMTPRWLDPVDLPWHGWLMLVVGVGMVVGIGRLRQTK